MLLQYIHIFFPDLFCEVHQSFLQQSTATTWCCHPVLHGWDGVLWLASLPLLPPNIMVIMFHQMKVRSLSPCAVANHSLAVLEQWLLPCWAAFQVMSIQDLFYCGYRYFCTCFLQHPHKVLCCCSGIDLHFSHQSTFISRRQNASSPERYDGCVVPWCLYLHTIVCTDERGTFRDLEIAPMEEPDLWRSRIFIPEGLADLFWYSHDVKQRGTEFEGRPWNTSTGTPPIDSNDVKWCQLAFSKQFKGTVNLVYVNFWPTGILIQWNNLSVNNFWKNYLCHA